jgi:glycosyltransferase involved in cell wall biosynthesis
MRTTVFVTGGGPRERRISASLLREGDPEFLVRSFDSIEPALSEMRHVPGSSAWIDGRLAPDAAALQALIRSTGARGALARGPNQNVLAPLAAAAAPSGSTLADFLRSPQRAAGETAAGDWMSWDADAAEPQPLNGQTVRFHANAWSFTGYAVASRHLMLGMRRAGVDVAWLPDWPEGEPAELDDEDKSALNELMRRPPNPHGPCIIFNTPTFPDGRPLLTLYRQTLERAPMIAMTMFESDAIPFRWRAPLADAERVWVPSSFNLETFAAAGVPREKLDFVPLGLDFEHFPIDGPTLKIPNVRSFVFLSIFEWRRRKGYDVLLRAWAKAFTRDDDVSLVIRASLFNFDIAKELRNELTTLGLDAARMAPIVLLPNKVPQPDLAALYRTADAFVVPSRGEAFGLPYLEAMSLGIPTIGTEHGGAIDFLDRRNAYPIPARIVEVDAEFARFIPYYRAQRWAEPSVEETARAMRAVFEDREEAGRRAARGAALARTRYNRVAIGRIAATALERVETPRRIRRSIPVLGEYYAIAYSLAGYGSESRSFLRAIDAVGASVCLRPVSYEDAPTLLRAEESRLLNRYVAATASPKSPVLFHLMPTQIPQLPDNRPTIVRTMEETDGLGEGWVEASNRFTEVWVPSQFNFDTFANAGVDSRKLRIVPGAIDTDFWSPDAGGLDITGFRGFRFLSVFDWMSRKGWDLLVSAYCRAFRASDDVSLTLKATDLVARAESRQLNLTEEITAFLARTFPERYRSGDLPHIIPLAMNFTENELVQVYGSHDVFVCPSRAEGWGRAHFEAMSCAMPTIGTRWGGNLAFMNDENSYLVDVEALVPAERDTARYAGRRWAQPSVEHLEELLRRVYSRREESRARGLAARGHIVANFSLPIVGALLRERFEELQLPASLEEELRPPVDTELAIIVPDAGLPAFARCAHTIAASTRSSYVLLPVASNGVAGAEPTFQQAYARAQSARYIAIVSSDVAVGPAWDRILIDAIESRYNVPVAVPLTRTATGPQRTDNVSARYDIRTLAGFDRFALNNKLLANERGSYANVLAPACAIFDAAKLRPVVDGDPSAMSFQGILRRVLTRIGHGWVASDCYVHDDGSATTAVTA